MSPVSVRRYDGGDTPRTGEKIYAMLRDEIAIPALRRFERAHRADAVRPNGGSHACRHPTRPAAVAGTPPWFADLLPHLRIEAQLLAQRGLSVDKVRRRFDALMRHEHPGVSWRAMRTGLERDAFPFALGATVLSVLVDTVDPKRRLAMIWPPIEALGVVLINIVGMARFNAAHPSWASRLGQITPTQALESISATLRSPVRDVAAHVVGFVFCYGVVRNLARLGAEAGLSAALPGIMATRFGNTIHSCLEILLCPIPGAFLGPIVDRIAIAPEDARLEPLLQDRFGDLICQMSDDMPPEASTPFWRSFRTHLVELLQSSAPKAIWLTLSLGFYFLSTFHRAITQINADDVVADTYVGTAGNTTMPATTAVAGTTSTMATMATTATACGPGDGAGIDWHSQAVLSVLYGLIATFVSMQGISARHDAIATAYLRRRGRPKISTATVMSQGDSGHSSAGSHSDLPDSPASPCAPPRALRQSHPANDIRTPDRDTCGATSGDTSGDDSVFLPMDDPARTSSDRRSGGPRAADTPQARKHGTSVAPSGIYRETSREGDSETVDAAEHRTPL
ncbi:hypothetical protein [Pandoraea vervacti]|nr:hypothetical protein [Pandoraea vervacti]